MSNRKLIDAFREADAYLMALVEALAREAPDKEMLARSRDFASHLIRESVDARTGGLSPLAITLASITFASGNLQYMITVLEEENGKDSQ